MLLADNSALEIKRASAKRTSGYRIVPSMMAENSVLYVVMSDRTWTFVLFSG